MDKPVISIRYPFAIDQKLGILREEKDFSLHVRQMIIQVLFTNPGERINRPDFGCGLRRMVFAPNSDVTANLLHVLVIQSLDKWLGELIQVEKVDVKAVEEKMMVSITYILKAKLERQYLNVEV